MSDVKISYSVLNELNGSLKQILVELEDASKRASALEAAIGDPRKSITSPAEYSRRPCAKRLRNSRMAGMTVVHT